MIVAYLDKVEQQILMTSEFQKAFDFLRCHDIEGLADGKVEIDGSKVFALVQRYITNAADIIRFEHHRKYIDIQYIVSGEEIIGWAPAELMAITENYVDKDDICFGAVARKQITLLHLKAGQLAVFFPEDGHAPRLAHNTPSPVLKIVIKVAVEPMARDGSFR
jgi:biofilm protein TabA